MKIIMKIEETIGLSMKEKIDSIMEPEDSIITEMEIK